MSEPRTQGALFDCASVQLDLLLGATLSAEASTHAATCRRCQAALAAVSARPRPLPAPVLPSPHPDWLRRRVRRRAARRLGLTGVVAAAVALLTLLGAPEPAPEHTPAEPDLIALLEEVSVIASEPSGDPPGTEALALLDPLGADPFADLPETDPLSDLFTPWSTP